MSAIDLLVPDLGNFTDVPVIDVLIHPGDAIEVDTPLITLETDKASMDVPSAAAGTVSEVLLKRGDKVTKGTVIARLERQEPQRTSAAASAAPAEETAAPARPARETAATTESRDTPASVEESAGDTVRMRIPETTTRARVEAQADRAIQLLVLGSGPGGYTAAFRAADLGLKVMLVERSPCLGGVCLNVGCIPSKALLHAAKVIEDAEAMGVNGIAFGAPAIDLQRLRAWKSSIVNKLTGGLKLLAKQRKVEVVHGTGRFAAPNIMEVTRGHRSERIRFEQCIIAAGSEAIRLPGWPSDPRIMDSTEALELPEFDGRLLVVGGGIIGLEMACVYDGLGSHVSVVELTPQLMPGCDPDLVKPLEKRVRARYEQILLATKVAAVEPTPDGLTVTFAGAKAPTPQTYDRVLVAVGRTPMATRSGPRRPG